MGIWFLLLIIVIKIKQYPFSAIIKSDFFGGGKDKCSYLLLVLHHNHWAMAFTLNAVTIQVSTFSFIKPTVHQK